MTKKEPPFKVGDIFLTKGTEKVAPCYFEIVKILNVDNLDYVLKVSIRDLKSDFILHELCWGPELIELILKLIVNSDKETIRLLYA